MRGVARSEIAYKTSTFVRSRSRCARLQLGVRLPNAHSCPSQRRCSAAQWSVVCRRWLRRGGRLPLRGWSLLRDAGRSKIRGGRDGHLCRKSAVRLTAARDSRGHPLKMFPRGWLSGTLRGPNGHREASPRPLRLRFFTCWRVCRKIFGAAVRVCGEPSSLRT
jgi:hypothetical protein